MKKILATVLVMFVAMAAFAQTVNVTDIAVTNSNTGETVLVKDFTVDTGVKWFGKSPSGNTYLSTSSTLFVLDNMGIIVRGLPFIQITVDGKTIKMGMTEAELVAALGKPSGTRQGAFLYYMYPFTVNARLGFLDGKLYEVRF